MTKDLPLNYFQHVFLDHGASRTVFLLHGTGGDERDLLPLVEPLGDQVNVVGLKGNVEEQGMARFFRRFSEGSFDQENIAAETQKLAKFLKEWLKIHNQQPSDLAFVGFSNGANMILALAFRYPELVSRAAVLHPMLPFEPDQRLSLQDKAFLVSYGENDFMVPLEESLRVVKTLESHGAQVEVVSHFGGHQLSHGEVEHLHTFLSP